MRDPTPGLTHLAGPGTYVVVYHLPAARAIRVGRLGKVELSAGFFSYVGSALGSGGLPARLRHHLGRPARPHWHVDYLRRVARPVEAWVCAQPIRREHDWAHLLSRVRCVVPVIEGFGTSDCRCSTHLFHWAQVPSIAVFQRLVHIRFPTDAAVCLWNLSG